MALQGTLDTFALPDVLHLLAATSKTGRLLIEGDRGTGGVWVADGAVVAADADNMANGTPVAEVVFELLRFTSGSFAFDGTATPPRTDRSEDVGAVLRRAHALLSEWGELESIVPSLDHQVSLADDLSADEVTIDADRWRSVVAVAAGSTVRQLAATLGLTELGVSRVVRDLVDLGVAEVGPPSAARPGRGRPSEVPATSVPPAPAIAAPAPPASAIPDTAVGGRDGSRPAVREAPDSVTPMGRGSSVTGKSQRAGWLAGDRTGEVPAVEPSPREAVSNGHARGAHDDLGGSTDAPAPPPPPGSPAKGGLTSRLGLSRNAGGSRSPGRRTTGSTPAVGPAAGNGSGPGATPGPRPSPPARTNDAGHRNGVAGHGHGTPGRATSSRSGAGAASSRQTPGGPTRGGEPPRPSTSSGLPRRSDSSRNGAPNGRGADPTGPARPSSLNGGRLGPDTGRIPAVPPSALPADLHWAADDTLASPFNGGPTTGPITGPVGPITGPVTSPFSGLSSLGPGRAPVPPPNRSLLPANRDEMAPHVAAMSPQARAAVQATVGNTGGSTGGRGSQGEDIAQRGRLISFLSTVR